MREALDGLLTAFRETSETGATRWIVPLLSAALLALLAACVAAPYVLLWSRWARTFVGRPLLFVARQLLALSAVLAGTWAWATAAIGVMSTPFRGWSGHGGSGVLAIVLQCAGALAWFAVGIVLLQAAWTLIRPSRRTRALRGDRFV